ncbi:MAG: hypothetical protein IIU88_04130, partial [Clostridia bacterium]|nr:hypothetical protein [Clostridia bacterium]
VAFDAEPGEHTLVIRYVPKQMYLGLCITAVSAALLLAIFFTERAVKKHRKNFEVEIVELPEENAIATEDTPETETTKETKQTEE